MGNWNITIRGVGQHHNKGASDDADTMAKAFVAALKNAGHAITDASITYGAAEELADARGPGINVEDLARQAFNAYNAQGPNPGKTHDGKDVPAWDKLNDQVRAKWMAAALHVYDRS